MRKFQISGKNLGELNHVAYCERCVWIKLRLQHRLPYQVLPGVFSSIDAYTKRIIEHLIDTEGLPEWLGRLGDVVGYERAPGYPKFLVDDPETGISLTGTVDALFVRSDGSYLIADYKTSRHTPGQDALRPTYDAQLNAYAWIAERTAWSPVTVLALVYMHPLTTSRDAKRPINQRANGFVMEFAPHVEPVAIRPDLIPTLLRRARAVFDQPTSPEARYGCKDCAKVDRLAHLLI